MNIKTTTMIAALACCTSAFAVQDGGYVGASIGLPNFSNSRIQEESTTQSSFIYRNAADLSPNATINVGYGYHFDKNAYMGVELFADFGHSTNITEADIAGTAVTNEWTSKNSFGVRVQPGYMLNPQTLLFASLGLIRTKADFDIVAPTAESFNKTQKGVTIGAGSSIELDDQWSLRADYSYTHYSSYIITAASGDEYTFKPRSTKFSLGVTYNFLPEQHGATSSNTVR